MIVTFCASRFHRAISFGVACAEAVPTHSPAVSNRIAHLVMDEKYQQFVNLE
jgi:hypothetical protein